MAIRAGTGRGRPGSQANCPILKFLSPPLPSVLAPGNCSLPEGRHLILNAADSVRADCALGGLPTNILSRSRYWKFQP